MPLRPLFHSYLGLLYIFFATIEELRQDTRRILDALLNPPPMNGHR
ncbi:hypothetical protein [Synechococcus sp. C9]|nr:hypothetical protein [Synechococcus sp. C9]